MTTKNENSWFAGAFMRWLPVIISLAGIITSYTRLQTQVEADSLRVTETRDELTVAIGRFEEKIDELGDCAQSTAIDIATIKKDIEFIKGQL